MGTSDILEHALNTRWPNKELTIDEDSQCKGKRKSIQPVPRKSAGGQLRLVGVAEFYW